MSLQISFISPGLYSVLILFAPRFLVPVAIESSFYSGRHVMLSFRNLTLLLIVVLSSALSEAYAQTTLTLSGEIMNSTNDVFTSAQGGASLHPTATFGLSRSSSIRFADPLNKDIGWWGGRVTANSVGSRTQINNRGVHSTTQSTPFFEGT